MSVILITPKRHGDERGWLSESWNRKVFAEHGIDVDFCQDNHSMSAAKFTLRGLHFQTPPHAQAKLVRCLRGAIFDVAVDVRRASPTFGKWVAATLTADKGEQLFVPRGYAHGFLTLEANCEVAYKTDGYYAKQSEDGLIWSDLAVGIEWPCGDTAPLLKPEDAQWPMLADLTVDFPYNGQPLRPLSETSVCL